MNLYCLYMYSNLNKILFTLTSQSYIKVVIFSVELSCSTNAKCYKILKIDVWSITASARHRIYG